MLPRSGVPSLSLGTRDNNEQRPTRLFAKKEEEALCDRAQALRPHRGVSALFSLFWPAQRLIAVN